MDLSKTTRPGSRNDLPMTVVIPAYVISELKTGFQMGALGTLLAGDSSAAMLHIQFLPVSLIGEAMLCVAAVLTLTTGWDYLTAGLRHASHAPPVTGRTDPVPPHP